MFNITDEVIRNICPIRIVYLKGQQYYRANRVQQLNFNSQKMLFDAVVSGSQKYNVRIEFDKNGEFIGPPAVVLHITDTGVPVST